jgi:hypothetical protein
VALLGCAAIGGSLLRRRTIVLGLAALLTIALFLLLASRVPGSPITLWADAFLDRLVTLGQGETLHEDSLRWRYVENSYALKQITSHPFFGLGLGAHYRPFDPKLDVSGMAWDARGYIHNGHLWIMVSIGLLGYASWVWLWLRFMQHGISQWHRLPHPGAGGRVLALTMAFGGAMLASLTSPLPMEWFWVPVLGMMMGIAEVTLRLGSQTQSGFLQ